MTLPPYPGQPEQPEQPGQSGQSGQPGQPPAPSTPPPPPAPPSYPSAYPQGAGQVPPPPGPPAPPAPPSYSQFGGSNDAAQPWSGLAIASFVCSLTCCLGIPAIILGAIAITKTGAGKAKGRWMAVTGIVLGILGTLLLAGLAVGGTFFVKHAVVTPENAEVGQCVTVETDGDNVTMLNFGCDTDHNGQIFDVITVSAADEERQMGGLDLCVASAVKKFPEAAQGNLDGVHPTFRIGGEELEIGGASKKTEVEAGNVVACWVEATDDQLQNDPVH